MKTFTISMTIRDAEGFLISTGKVDMEGETAFEAMDNLERLLSPAQVAVLPAQTLSKKETIARNILAREILFEIIGKIKRKDAGLLAIDPLYTLDDPDLFEVVKPAKVAHRIATEVILQRRKS